MSFSHDPHMAIKWKWLAACKMGLESSWKQPDSTRSKSAEI